MYGSKSGSKSTWVLILLILAGIVLGGFIGEYLGAIKYLEWLSFGSDFGLSSPVKLDLGVIILQFGLTIKFSIAGIIGIILAVLVYKKL